MNFPRLELTRNGIDAVLEAVFNSKTLTFTNARLGSGNTTAQTETMTNLVMPVKTVGFSSCTIANKVASLVFTLRNSDITAGFYMRELGIFARIDNGNEFLYAYSNAGSKAAYIKPYEQDSLVELPFVANVAIGDADSVTAVISGAVGYATSEDLSNHVNDFDNPHRVTKEQVGLGNVPDTAPSDMKITFSKSSTLNVPTSGSKLSVLMGYLAKAIDSLGAHLRDKDNPHVVTYEQTHAAAENHTHTIAEMEGTVPISKGGTGVTTIQQLTNLINSMVDTSSGGTFMLTIGNATKTVGDGNVTFTLSEMGVSAETSFTDCKSSFTWNTGMMLNRETGALEQAESWYSQVRYGRREVSGGEEFQIVTWLPYNYPYFAIYDGDGNVMSWYTATTMPYVTREMYRKRNIFIPSGAAYVIAIDFTINSGRSADEYTIGMR